MTRSKEHKFKVGDPVVVPATEKAAGVVVGIDEAEGTIDLKRGKSSKARHPHALIPAGPVQTNAMRHALRRVADYVIGRGMTGHGAYRIDRFWTNQRGETRPLSRRHAHRGALQPSSR